METALRQTDMAAQRAETIWDRGRRPHAKAKAGWDRGKRAHAKVRVGPEQASSEPEIVAREVAKV